MNLSDMVKNIQEIGYEPDDARARVCQDIGAESFNADGRYSGSEGIGNSAIWR